MEAALDKRHPEYVKMIRTYPQLMEPSFIKGKLAHGVWHHIDITDHPPTKSKRRPIIANSAKAAMGKERWDQMEQDGIIAGKHTKAHGIRHKWLSGLRNTLRLEIGTIQNGDVGIRHKFLIDR